jgi:CubicO group peptidase (beta-lactamase class C family)
MHRTLIALAAAAATVALTAAAPAPLAAQSALTEAQRSAMDRLFAEWSLPDGPGCALGVSRGGQLLYERGYGMANLETDTPIIPASIFHVASVSKQFTAAALVLLEREGRLSLEDDIRTYLPEIPEYGHRITIRQLLEHTSGIRDQWELLFMARGRFEENRITEDDVLEIVARQRALNFVPGTEHLYSNSGYTLAAVIVQRVSGQSLRDFAEARIFRPLGMTRTHFHDDYTRVVRGRAAGYRLAAGGAWHVSLPNYDTYGATSLFTTVGDLLTWSASLARPGGEHPALGEALRRSGTLAAGDTTGYGLGIMTELYRGTRLEGHGGADAGYRTYLGTFPEHDLSVAVLCNAAPAMPGALARRVADVILGDALGPQPATASAPAGSGRTRPAARELDRLAGLYSHPVTGAPVWITRRGESLVLGRQNGPVLVPLGGGRFQVTGQPVELEFRGGTELVQTPLGWPQRRPVTLVRRQESRPSAEELSRFAGSYHSEELGATYTVTATEDGLTLRTRWGRDRTVRPAYGDTFSGDYLITFVRDVSGQVTGMTMGGGRVRGIAFDRIGG